MIAKNKVCRTFAAVRKMAQLQLGTFLCQKPALQRLLPVVIRLWNSVTQAHPPWALVARQSRPEG
jgi:hypothetical protein